MSFPSLEVIGKRYALPVCLAALAAAILGGLFAGCGQDRQYEYYPDLIQRAQDTGGIIYLIQAQHPHGWGRTDCFHCHVVNNIHQINRSPDTFDNSLLEYARGAKESECTVCHGDNGATP